MYTIRTCAVFALLVLVLGKHAGGDDSAPHWSLRKPVRPPVPDVRELPHGERARNPIDAFILQRLVREELAPAPLADKYELVRRAYFDLLGLPPKPEEVDAFVRDDSADAWPKLIDRLLASPHYGERWGRHWLDVARYADSAGFEGDNSYRNAWRYRDYVVQSLNEDKPYNTFVEEQIAGDELWPDNLDLDPKRVYEVSPEKARHLNAWIGTGLYCFGPRIHESSLDGRRLHHETLTDWADTTGSVFLGLTLGCARCHDHKSDPLTQQDYYAMQAVFTSSVEIEIPIITRMELESWHHAYPRIIAVHEARTAYKLFKQRTSGRPLTDVEKEEESRLRGAIVDRLMELPDGGNSRPNTAYDALMQVPTATVLGHERPELIKPVHVLERGELSMPQELVAPALPVAVAAASGRSKELRGPFGSRKELALWLTQPDHPLTARVLVNRIWQWHFGQGIVTTPNDFGAMGTAPTHPELLDWLATEFVARGWSIKSLHRLIMTSSTYQQTSRFATAEHVARDPQNRWLWRMNRRRLEAEALWDAVHATAGTINLKLGGRPVVPTLTNDESAALREKWQWPVSADPAEHTRRGLYILVLRNFRFPMFAVYDAPVTSVSCPQRDVTTVAPQALWSLNSPSVYRQAVQLAARVVKESGSAPNDWLARLWMIALGRHITDKEQHEAADLLTALCDDALKSETATLKSAADDGMPESLAQLPAPQARALVQLCLAVYNLSEFTFVD